MVTLADMVGMEITRIFFISYHGKCLSDSRAATIKGVLGRMAADERVADIVGAGEIVQALKRRGFGTQLVPETLPDYPAVSKIVGIRSQHVFVRGAALANGAHVIEACRVIGEPAVEHQVRVIPNVVRRRLVVVPDPPGTPAYVAPADDGDGDVDDDVEAASRVERSSRPVRASRPVYPSEEWLVE